MNPRECKQFEIEIVDHILGNLPSNRSQALQNHLARCRSCRKLYEEWLEILKDGISVEPSALLYKRLKNSFLRGKSSASFSARQPLWSAASVAVIAMFILAITAIQVISPWNHGNSFLLPRRYSLFCHG